jgi:hypothetical protein
MCRKIVIIGAGGFACQVLDILEVCNHSGTQYEILGYIVEPVWGEPGSVINGFPVLGDFDWFDTCREEVFAITAVADPGVRLRLVGRAKEKGVRFCNIIHPLTTVTRNVSMGEDVLLRASSTLSFQNTIGNHVNVNMGCCLGEKTQIEDFVTLYRGAYIR